MSASLTKENFVWHKIHSLTGIIPVGFYMVQHLTLNSFTLAGPDKFNGVVDFFGSLPKHFLLGLEIVAIWIPLLFHAIYGLFIAGRAKPNYFSEKYGWSQNRMYLLQRWSGIFIFFFLCFHVFTTTVAAKVSGESVIHYDAWHRNLSANGYILFLFYLVGILTCSYHLAYGIWNFCIRWGITITDEAQLKVQKVSGVLFVAITLLGWAALGGFLIHGDGVTSSAPADAGAQNVSISIR